MCRVSEQGEGKGVERVKSLKSLSRIWKRDLWDEGVDKRVGCQDGSIQDKR